MERRICRPAVEIIPPRNEVPRGTRLATEHDVTDAFFARVDFQEKFGAYIEKQKKEAVDKATKKVEETQKKSLSSLPTKFLLVQLFVVLEIYLLKTFHLI